MIHRDDVPETPEWSLPARECDGSADYVRELTIPPLVELGEN